MGVALLIKITAEFRHLIEIVIPEIIQSVDDDDWEVNQAATEALLTLSDRGMTTYQYVIALLMKIIAEWRLLIGTAIPEIAKLLTDDIDIYLGVKTLSRLSEKS